MTQQSSTKKEGYYPGHSYWGGIASWKEFNKKNGRSFAGRTGRFNKKNQLMEWNYVHHWRYHITHITSPCGQKYLTSQQGRHLGKEKRLVKNYPSFKYFQNYTPEELLYQFRSGGTMLCAICWGLGRSEGKGTRNNKARRWLEEAKNDDMRLAKKFFLRKWGTLDPKKDFFFRKDGYVEKKVQYNKERKAQK